MFVTETQMHPLTPSPLPVRSARCRYCHVFVKGELDALVATAGLEVVEGFYDKSNWCVHAKKPAGHQ